ncbi:hypothetical protein GGF31_006169 [Allomyces arbusculus]|nr:hypothetical protein GGF31_006169 [Allomyces arbusculus]
MMATSMPSSSSSTAAPRASVADNARFDLPPSPSTTVSALVAMFPTVDPDTAAAAYAAHGHDMDAAVSALLAITDPDYVPAQAPVHERSTNRLVVLSSSPAAIADLMALYGGEDVDGDAWDAVIRASRKTRALFRDVTGKLARLASPSPARTTDASASWWRRSSTAPFDAPIPLGAPKRGSRDSGVAMEAPTTVFST